MANTHDVSQVLEKGYKPRSDKEKALFIEKQKFVFSVLREHLQTGKTRKIICTHKSTGNAQKAFQALVKLFESGTIQQLEQEWLEKMLGEWKLGPHWSNTIESFLTG